MGLSPRATPFLSLTFFYVRSAHDQTLTKTHQVHESVQLLSTSHSELARITSRSEGKLCEIEGIGRQTQAAVHELADRFVRRESGRMIENEGTVQRLIVAFGAMLKEQLSEHQASRGKAPGVPSPLHDSSRHVPICQSNSEKDRICPHGRVYHTYSPNGYFDTSDDEYSNDLPLTEKTSTFRNRLGKVMFRTISRCYSSVTELAGVSLPITLSSRANDPPHFPITITTTEILLIPCRWSRTRFATILCQNIISPTSNISDMSFQINELSKPSTPNQRSRPTSKSFQVVQGVFDMQRKGARRSSKLLYIAFRTACYGTKSQQRKHNKKPLQQLVVRDPVPRNSFDVEINDALELIQLWINSGFDSEVYRQAFPGDVAEKVKIEQECQAIVRSGSQTPRDFQRLRLEYTFHVISEMIAQGERNLEHDTIHLDAIHMAYWDQIQMVAMPKLQPPSWRLQIANKGARLISFEAGVRKLTSYVYTWPINWVYADEPPNLYIYRVISDFYDTICDAGYLWEDYLSPFDCCELYDFCTLYDYYYIVRGILDLLKEARCLISQLIESLGHDHPYAQEMLLPDQASIVQELRPLQYRLKDFSRCMQRCYAIPFRRSDTDKIQLRSMLDSFKSDACRAWRKYFYARSWNYSTWDLAEVWRWMGVINDGISVKKQKVRIRVPSKRR